MTNTTDWYIEVTREALAQAERHGFMFPSQLGHRVLVTDKGIATLRVDNEEFAQLTMLISIPGEAAMVEERAQLSDYYDRAHPDAELLDWVEEMLIRAKSTLL